MTIRENKNSRNKQSIILLIDGNALVHRAFHGMPELKTKKGQLVNAVYGFTSAILSSIKEFQPKYIVVAWDVGKKTFRTEKYADYKATRKKAPQELYDQFPLTKEVCETLNIPQFGIKNYEADDIIGTISSKISNFQFPISNKFSNSNDKNSKSKIQNLKSIIVTGDMDALQLVNNNTNVYSVSRGIKKAILFDKEKVREKYGFGPEQLIDYKALRGDPSDNIPGVPGVGDKTATDLIKKFGTIDKLYDYLEEKIRNPKSEIRNKSELSNVQNSKQNLKTKTIDLLLKYKDQAYLSKELATICKETPLEFKLSDAKVSDYDPKKVEKLFYELEFKSLLKRLPEYKPNHTQEKLF